MVPGMLTRWRDEIETGRQRAEALARDAQAFVWKMIQVAFVAGLLIGAAATAIGVLIWQTIS